MDIDLAPFEHKVLDFEDKCQHDPCPIFSEMRDQRLFTENRLDHIRDFKHPTTACDVGDGCAAFKRLLNGGNVLKDRCHVALYRHPPRDRGQSARSQALNDGIRAFSLNDEFVENAPLHYVTAVEREELRYNEKNGFLDMLIDEVIANGFEHDLYNDENHERMGNIPYPLMTVVAEKLRCRRHKRMGSCLNTAEMLALLLYTGGESNHALCAAQRNGDYATWMWFDLCLYSAISKLSKREHGSYTLYTGLKSTRLTSNTAQSGYFKTYVSTSWMRDIALGFADETGMLFEIDANFRKHAVACDISWISKFGQTECEVLIARSIDAILNHFQCKVVDKQHGTQIVALSLYERAFEDNSSTPRLNVPDSVSKSRKLPLERVTETAKVDLVQINLVNIFILSLKLDFKRSIHSDITRCIALFCTSRIDDDLLGHSDYVEASSDSRLFRMTQVEGLGHVFWKTALFGHIGNIRAWYIRIDALRQQKTRWRRYRDRVLIGIQDMDKRFPNGFVGLGHDGKLYRNNKEAAEIKQNSSFSEGDMVVVLHDAKRGILKLSVQGVDRERTDVRINNVSTDSVYGFAVFMEGKHTTITLTRCCEPELLDMVSLRNVDDMHTHSIAQIPSQKGLFSFILFSTNKY